MLAPTPTEMDNPVRTRGLVDDRAYRIGAARRAAYDPALMAALLVPVRGREQVFSGDRAGVLGGLAYKVITGMRTPDHSTIAEFRRRHELEIGELFDDVLGVCREAGLLSVGVIAIDGTKINANASMDQNRSYRELVGQTLREAEETDRREDELYGETVVMSSRSTTGRSSSRPRSRSTRRTSGISSRCSRRHCATSTGTP